MAVKPNAKTAQVKEQIFEDLVTELTLVFSVRSDGGLRLTLCGDNLPFGNRDFIFSPDGEIGATGTGTAGACRPSWLRAVPDG